MARPLTISEQIEVVPHEPHRPIRQETFEQIGAHLVVVRAADCLADVVEQRRRPENPIVGAARRELEDLERVEERITFRVIARGLLNAV